MKLNSKKSKNISQPDEIPTPVEPLYHKTCDNLPLNKFIDCIVDGNLQALTISGFPTQGQLQAAWENILVEYSEAMGSTEYRMYVQLFKDISISKIILDQLTIALNILQVTYDEFFHTEVNRILRTDCKFNWKDQASYQAEIKKCFNRSKALKIALDLKLLKFESIEAKNKNKTGQKIDRKYFISVLITLSDHAKYQIQETIKMNEYCERVRRFTEYCEQQKTFK
jgi:hypothetical protein